MNRYTVRTRRMQALTEQAAKMIVAMVAIGVLIAVMSHSVIPLVILGAVACSIWHVAKAFRR